MKKGSHSSGSLLFIIFLRMFSVKFFKFFHWRKRPYIRFIYQFRLIIFIFLLKNCRLRFSNIWYIHRISVVIPLGHTLRFMPCNALNLRNRQPLPLQFGIQKMPPAMQCQSSLLNLIFGNSNFIQCFV